MSRPAWVFRALVLFAPLLVANAQAQQPSLACRVLEVLRQRCASCHDEATVSRAAEAKGKKGRVKGSFGDVLDLVALTKERDIGVYIKPKDAKASYLLERVNDASDPMPPGEDLLPKEERDLIQKWIEAGAPPCEAGPESESSEQPEQVPAEEKVETPATRSEEALEDVAKRARAVLDQHCLRCHNGPNSKGGDWDVFDIAALTRDGEYIVPGKPEESYLFERLAVDQDMPPLSVPERLTRDQIEAVRRWIAAGALPFAHEERRAHLPLVRVLSAVRDDLREHDRRDRPFLRYFTLHHLYNDPRTKTQDLPVHRAALSKALNSLSWKERIVIPREVRVLGLEPDARRERGLQQTLYAIDVRHYDWDRTRAWNALQRAYPYGLGYDAHPNEDLRRLDEDIRDLTGCELAVLRADWFVATATRPPLYHTILNLPDHAGALERALGVDIQGNFNNPTAERIARGGFSKSGVASGINRLVERHEAKTGVYWKSYDFLAGSPRSKLTRFPLGPLNLFPNGRHPFPRHAFIHDGGEIIFSLPNRLQAYLLVDGEDRRIDEGPINVVSDALETSGTPVIVNGLSCMACHRTGMIPFVDAIRERSAVFGDAERKVRDLYPQQSKLNELLERDSRRFLDSLQRATDPFEPEDPALRKPVRERPEPVGHVARNYIAIHLNLRTVAAELDLEDPELILERVGKRRLKLLGLENLLEENGVITRLEWEAVDAVSLMQELARELGYTPRSPL